MEEEEPTEGEGEGVSEIVGLAVGVPVGVGVPVCEDVGVCVEVGVGVTVEEEEGSVTVAAWPVS
jgi:hypothetical protein